MQEVLALVAEHAKTTYGFTEISAELVEQVRGAIQEDAQARAQSA